MRVEMRFISTIWATSTRSSTACMVLPTIPYSTTGQCAFTNRASEVPPVVENSGTIPVSASTALATRSDKGPGGVIKLSPEILNLTSVSVPHAASTWLASERIQSDKLAPVWASLNRMFTHDVVSAGMTLVAGLSVSIVSTATVEASQPVHQARYRRHRVNRAMRIRRMPLLAYGFEPNGH